LKELRALRVGNEGNLERKGTGDELSSSTELTDTAYDILKMLGKDADFLYDTIETYIKDAEKANKSDLVEILQTIKIDRKNTCLYLKRHWKKRFMDNIRYCIDVN
jgi:hypothetical protein